MIDKDESNVQRLSVQLLDFLEKSGPVSTRKILERFESKVKEEETTVFKSLLHKLAEFDKTLRLWTLRPDFVKDS